MKEDKKTQSVEKQNTSKKIEELREKIKEVCPETYSESLLGE